MSIPQRIPNYPVQDPGLVPAMDFLQRWIPGQWTPVGSGGSTYLNGWRHYLGGNGVDSPALWRREGDYVAFTGVVDKNGGNFVGGENMLQLPPEMRIPTSTRQFGVTGTAFGGGGSFGGVWLIYTVATGVLMFYAGLPGSPLTNPVVNVHLSGLRFPLI